MMGRLLDWAEHHPWRLFAGQFSILILFYQFALRMPIRPPIIIPTIDWDAYFPVVPFTAYIYVSYFLILPSWVLITRRVADPKEGARLLVAIMLVMYGNLSINILIPTELSRILAPEDAGGWLLALIVETDAPRAALPSGHCSLPTALTMLSILAGLRSRWLYATWALLIGVAVLTTRQHVMLDAFAGVAYGIVAPMLVYHWLQRRGAAGRPSMLGAQRAEVSEPGLVRIRRD